MRITKEFLLIDRTIKFVLEAQLAFGGRSSIGRALQWHCRGRRFDSDRLHTLYCPINLNSKEWTVKKYDKNVKAIQDMLKKNGVKMSAIEIRELMKTTGLSANEDKIKAYVRQLRRGY